MATRKAKEYDVRPVSLAAQWHAARTRSRSSSRPAQVRDRLDSFEHDGRTFWHAPADSPPGPQQPAGHLLQILDEAYRGYQDSRRVLDAAGHVPRGRETAAGMSLVDAQIVAAMRRTLAHDHVEFSLRPYRALLPEDVGGLEQAVRRYGDYLRLEPSLALQ